MINKNELNIAARFIPPGAVKIAAKDSDAIAYVYESKGRPCAIFYQGAQRKPIYHEHYAGAEGAKRREAKIVQHFGWRAAELARKEAERAERKAWVNPYKVGDIFVGSWGYEQSNVDYFEVVAVAGKHLMIHEIGQVIEYGLHGDRGQCWPKPGAFREDRQPVRVLAQPNGIKSPVHGYAWPLPVKEIVDGVPVYEGHYWSAYA